MPKQKKPITLKKRVKKLKKKNIPKDQRRRILINQYLKTPRIDKIIASLPPEGQVLVFRLQRTLADVSTPPEKQTSSRVKAVENLGGYGKDNKQAREKLVTLIAPLTRDPEGAVREIAVQQIGKLGNLGAKNAAPVLKQALKSRDENVVYMAINFLGIMGKQNLAWIESLFEHRSPRIVGFAMRTAARISPQHNASLTEKIMKKANHKNNFIRGDAYKALAELRQKGIGDLLEERTRTEQDPYARKSAREAYYDLTGIRKRD